MAIRTKICQKYEYSDIGLGIFVLKIVFRQMAVPCENYFSHYIIQMQQGDDMVFMILSLLNPVSR